MKRFGLAMMVVLSSFQVLLFAQSNAPESPATTLRINTQAVLVDVLVTDRNGAPVTGLKQDAFTVTEQGKPQTVTFFEEHKGTPQAAPAEMPKFPPNVFSNFSPFPRPPAVNVLLLDSLNTRMENQSFVHKQAMTFLKNAKPGARTAIFTMSLGLHFVQGFTDDPALLAAALGNKKNNEIETSVMIKGQDEANAQQNVIGMMSAPVPSGGGISATAASPEAIAALQNFLQENDDSRTIDRVLLTLANMQRLAAFLDGFPGRKNVIWFSESFPLVVSGNVDPQLRDELSKTMAILASARVALYPVDARGVEASGFYQAETNPSAAVSTPKQMQDAHSSGLMQEDVQRNIDQTTMEMIARETGGRAFLNTNGLSQIIADVTSSSGDFYTLSYTPANSKMDGTYRAIEVKLSGGKYNLSYRRGYTAIDAALPGGALAMRAQTIRKLASQSAGAVDPLLPFMDLGMPQSEQILYKAKIQPLPAKDEPAEKGKGRYGVDFAIDLKDLDLEPDADGSHKGTLNLSLIAYDRYGNIANRKDHIVALNIKPDVYAIYQQTGVQLHGEIEVPKGQYWLRTGIYDQGSHKVGTMEIPLNSVKTLQVAAEQ